jgi:hypothetical protein
MGRQKGRGADGKGCLSTGVRFEFESAILTHRGIYTSRFFLLPVWPCRLCYADMVLACRLDAE